MKEQIERWDKELVQRHIMNEVSYIRNYFNPRNIKTLNYIDIGANVGKFYDVLKQEYEIESVTMVEPAPMLNEYLKEKFKAIPNCKIYDFAISDEDGEACFNVDAILHAKNDDSMNMGVSKLMSHGSVTVKVVSGENFLLNYIENIEKINLIKIDTENRDYQVIRSIQSVVKKMKNKPLILFEHNHKDVLSREEAEHVLHNFSEECNYERLDYSKIAGDWLIRPLD